MLWRISFFLLWQLAYTELWFTDALWPDVDANLLQQAYQDFVVSDARSEKVFRVFQQRQPEPVTIPLSDLLAPVPTERDAHETPV